MYMSYCRFEGTYSELRRCLDDVEEHVNEEVTSPVSSREVDFFMKTVLDFGDWLQEMSLLDEDGFLDRSRLEEICEAMEKGSSGT